MSIAMARSNFLIRNATFIAIVVVTLLVIGASLLLARQTTATKSAQDWLLHTHQVKENTETLMAQIETVMITARDYLLEGKEEDLTPYADIFDGTKSGSVYAQIATLRDLTADNPVQQRNLDALQFEVKDFQNYLNSLIELRKSQNAAAPAAVDPARGKQLLDQLHSHFTAMIDEENRLLAVRAETDRLAATRINNLIVAALAVFYVAAVLAVLLCQIAERRAQAKLRENEERYALAIQGLSVGLWDWSIPTGEIYWSPRFLEIAGIADTDVVPSLDYVENHLHPDDRQSVMNQLNVYAGSGDMPVYQNECRFRRPDGSYVWLYSRGQAMCGKDGKVIRLVGCIEDITVRKEAEHEIQKHVDALRRSNQELDDFAYIASHDLKEPLRGLTNNAMFLKEDLAGAMNPETAKRLDRMTYLCQRLERLVDDLLYFSRLGRQELAIQKTDLNEVIKDIKLTMENTLHEANVNIVMPEDLPTIVCDLPRVTEVFRNLIVNGVKYNKNAQKRIEIGCVDPAPKSAGNDNAGRAFYVRDNGIGIPKEFYNDVFRIFKRLNAEDDSVKGTGVGLTFVRKIVERHGGKIWLDSEVGKGTTFYFTLNTKKEAS